MVFGERTPMRDLENSARMLERQKTAFIVERPEQCRAIMHELHARQIVLETQNEKLRSTRNHLERAYAKHKALFDYAPMGYLVLDRGGFIIEANRTFAFKAGKEVGQLIGKPFTDFISDASHDNFRSWFKSFFNHPETGCLDLRLKGAESRETRIAVFGNRALETADPSSKAPPSHEYIRIVCMDERDRGLAGGQTENPDRSLPLYHEMLDIIARNDGEEMFLDVLERLRLHFQSRYGYFGYIDDVGNLVCPSMTRDVLPKCQIENKSIVFTKSEWKGLWGESLSQEKAIRRNHGLNLPPGHIQLSNALVVPLLNQKKLVGQIALAEKEGGYSLEDERALTFIANCIAPVLAARLERNRYYEQRIQAENDLRQAQRMESVGVLTGGIAHDFNNILSPIIGYTEMLLEETQDTIRVQRHLKEVFKAAQRAKELVGQLLSFSRKQTAVFKSLDINLCIESLATLLCRLIREDITVVYDLDPQVKTVKADPGQIDQILLNLAVNAQDAMPNGGALTIATRCREIDSASQSSEEEIAPGAYVEICVADTGSGIAEEIRPLIFKPFFTTKEKGKGTGMGLATCYDIVRQHKGSILVESHVEIGTRMCVLLPVTACEANEEGAIEKETLVETDSRGETILVVEDEPAVRRIAVISLKRLGYQVYDVDSPEACMALAENKGLSFDLLLSDMIMPGGNGTDLYLNLKAKMPGLKVVFMSGYTDNVISDKGGLKEGFHFIGKPFSRKELSRTVREALDE